MRVTPGDTDTCIPRTSCPTADAAADREVELQVVQRRVCNAAIERTVETSPQRIVVAEDLDISAHGFDDRKTNGKRIYGNEPVEGSHPFTAEIVAELEAAGKRM